MVGPLGKFMLANGLLGVGRRPNPIIDSGWIIFAPSVDSRKIYVADATGGGSDANDGLSPSTPKLTLAAGLALMRSGFPDWLHLKCGSVWTDQEIFVRRSGRSATEPCVITYYGNGARPKIVNAAVIKRSTGGGSDLSLDYVFVNGLEGIMAKRDPDDPSYDNAAIGTPCSLTGQMGDWTIQDCKFSFGFNNAAVQKFNGAYARNIRFHRCIFRNAWAREGAPEPPNGHSSGIYCDAIDGLTISECFFDHNGWNETAQYAERNIFNHNMYLQDNCANVSVWGNISARGAATGCQLRTGGLLHRNLFIKNAIALFNTYANPPAIVYPAITTDNVIFQGDDIQVPSQLRGWGIEMTRNAVSWLASGNVVLNRISTNPVAGMFYNYSSLGTTAVLQVLNNVIYNWLKSPGVGIDIPAAVASECNRVGNIVDGKDQSGNTVPMVDPTRTMASYMAFIGKSGDEEEFFELCAARPLHTWYDSLSAGAVVDYIKAGYRPV